LRDNNWVREYLGKPYLRGAYGPDSYDCWGLVHSVFLRAFGVDLPHYPEDMTMLGIGREMKDTSGFADKGFDEVRDGSNGNCDILLMCGGTNPVHIGLLLNIDSEWVVLHAMRDAGVILTPKNRLASSGLKPHRQLRYARALRTYCMGE